jgi:ribosome-associated toxin RatA of RatAB toxin-antitoxin module
MQLEECFARTAGSPPLVQVKVASDHRPLGASAVTRIDRPLARVWQVVSEVDRYAERVPMVHRIRRTGDRVEIDLKFKVALFSAGFQFTAEVKMEREKWLELSWVAGEPRGIKLRFELTPLDGGQATLIRGDGEFDAMSLGWLVKFFLKHHPEILHGVFPGTVLVLLDAMRRAAESPA